MLGEAGYYITKTGRWLTVYNVAPGLWRCLNIVAESEETLRKRIALTFGPEAKAAALIRPYRAIR